MRDRLMRRVGDTAYRLASASRIPALRRRRAGAAIFTFHNVVPDDLMPERCDTSLHVPLSAFQDYLAVIADGYTVVPLAELGARVRQSRPVDRLAAITFDDAYRGVLLHAMPALARRGLPASVFVVSGATAAPAAFWWDLLANGGSVPAQVRDRALGELRGDREKILAQFPAGDVPMPPALLPASWCEVRGASRSGVTIGSHTVSHRNLSSLDQLGLREELERARAEIGAALGALPDEVAYPYGLHNVDVINAARHAGYTTGVTMQFGLVTRGQDPLALPRINVPAGISQAALECWAAGIRLRGSS